MRRKPSIGSPAEWIRRCGCAWRHPDGKAVEGISLSTDITCLEDEDPTDNRITLVVNLSSDQDLAGLTLRIPGLWKWNTDNTFTNVFTGDFAFSLEEDMGKDSVVTLDVDGVVAETTWGTHYHGDAGTLSPWHAVELPD